MHEGRYLFHLLAMFLVIAVIGVLELRRLIRPRWLVILFMATAIGRLGLALFDALRDVCARLADLISLCRQADTLLTNALTATLTRDALGMPDA